MLPPFLRPLQTGEIPDEVTVKRIRKWSIVLQNIFSILLLTIVGYLLFEEGFVGRVEEWIKIGLWAFGIDITIDKVVEQAKLVGK